MTGKEPQAPAGMVRIQGQGSERPGPLSMAQRTEMANLFKKGTGALHGPTIHDAPLPCDNAGAQALHPFNLPAQRWFPQYRPAVHALCSTGPRIGKHLKEELYRLTWTAPKPENLLSCAITSVIQCATRSTISHYFTRPFGNKALDPRGAGPGR